MGCLARIDRRGVGPHSGCVVANTPRRAGCPVLLGSFLRAVGLLSTALLAACDNYIVTAGPIATPETVITDDRLPGLWRDEDNGDDEAFLITSLGDGRYQIPVDTLRLTGRLVGIGD